jgi:steroid delta-isomerase-like uncharacterized protein
MSEQDNIAVIKAYFDASNAHDARALHDLRADNYICDDNGRQISRSESIQHDQDIFDAVPDFHYVMDLTIAKEEYVAVLWHGTGTFSQPLHLGTGEVIPPTGNHDTVRGIDIWQLKNGKITRCWQYYDTASLFEVSFKWK